METWNRDGMESKGGKEGAWEEEGSIVKKRDGRVVDGLFDKYSEDSSSSSSSSSCWR